MIHFQVYSRRPMPTFYDRFRECAERWPENIALEIQRREGTESYRYGEARRMAEALGGWLRAQRLERGTRCAILADNHPRWVVTYLGIIAAGCTAVPLDTALHAEQVAKLLKDSGTELVFCDRKHLLVARDAVRGMDVRIVLTEPAEPRSAGQPGAALPTGDSDDLNANFAAGTGGSVPVDAAEGDVASLLYTSGTTADPKGVMLTHGNLLGEVEAVFGWAEIGPDDALLGVLPLFHVLSQMANLLLPLVKGSRIVYLETLNTTELVRALRERQISAFAVVPQFFYLIHERIFKEAAKRGKLTVSLLRALMKINRGLRKFGINAGRLFFGKVHETFGKKMRYLVTGGSRFDPQIGHDFHDLGIDVLQAYGLTETSGGAFVTSPHDNVIGSVGKPLKGVEARIADAQAQEDGGPAVGEILIRGAIVMKGYWHREDATAAAIKNGWLHTGDLGYFDARGNLFITGRKKEVIILSNGKNVYPEEIEAHYSKSPYIKEICVLAIEAREGNPGSERLHAVVVPNFDVLKERKIVNAKEVIRFDIEGLSAQLPSSKRIASYDIWQESLPRTTTRKLKRFEIENLVREGRPEDTGEARVPTALSEDDVAWLARPEVQRVLKVIGEAAGKNAPEIRPADNLELDLGFDSMQRIEVLVALEQELGGDVEESRLAEIYTVRDLVDAVLVSASEGKAPAAARTPAAGWEVLLQEEPTDPDVLDLIRAKPVRETFWFLLSRLIAVFASDRFAFRLSGLEKLPAKGPYILSSNHQSFLDPMILAGVLPWPVFTTVFSVGTSEVFGAGFMRRLARWLRVVVVDPDANLVPAMRAGAYGLRHGRVLILYPEGERSIDGKPRIFKKGAAILSIHLQVPIIPVAIEGFHDAWPRGRTFPKFAPLRMKFGDAIYPPAEAEGSEAAYEKLTAELKARIAEMWQELRAEG